MNSPTPRSWRKGCQNLVAVTCAAMLLPGQGVLLAQATTSSSPVTIPPPPPAPATSAASAPAASSTTATAEADEPKLTADQLESLVAPIALYPDTLLAQTLVASTYPLEIVQLQQWLEKNKELKDKALTDAVAKQPWDPAIQGMATIPDLVKRLGNDIQWTTELGNAFLAQQSDVMDAVQRMRKKAQEKGSLASNEQQKVETQVIEEKTVIVVQQANPEVVYVPSYNPTVVYPPPVYAYPPVYYPPPGAAFMTFSVGVMVGAAFWGGGCGWGNNDININRNTNINVDGGNRVNGGGRGNGGNSSWKHDSSHRGAAPYSNKATASKYGGQGQGRGQTAAANRGAGASATSRSAGGASRGASPSATSRSAGAGASRSGASASARSSGGGGYNMGSKDFSSGSSSRSGGFGGGSGGFSGSSSRASSSRGASSMGGRGGGGGRRR